MNKSDYLRSLFRLKKVKVKDVAFKMNISPSTLSAKINGHRVFKEKEIEILLESLDMTYEEVFRVEKIEILENDKKVVVVDGRKFEVKKSTILEITKILDKEVV